MKDNHTVCIIKKRTGKWFTKRDLSSQPEIIEGEYQTQVLDDSILTARLIFRFNHESITCLKARAENRDIFYIEEDIHFNDAHDFYKNSF